MLSQTENVKSRETKKYWGSSDARRLPIFLAVQDFQFVQDAIHGGFEPILVQSEIMFCLTKTSQIPKGQQPMGMLDSVSPT